MQRTLGFFTALVWHLTGCSEPVGSRPTQIEPVWASERLGCEPGVPIRFAYPIAVTDQAVTVFLVDTAGRTKGIAALDPNTGEQRWCRVALLGGAGPLGPESPGLLLLDVSSAIISLDRSTGATRWSTALSPVGGSWGRASYGGDHVTSTAVATNAANENRSFEVFALDAMTGRLRWGRVDSTDAGFASTPRGSIAIRDTVWVYGTESLDRNSVRVRLFMYAYEGATGRSIGRFSTRDSASSTVASVAVWGDFFIFGNNEGGLLAMDHAGRVVWRVPGRGIGPGAAPSLMGGTVYAASADGTVRAVEAASGRPVWTTDLRYSLDAAAACENSVYVQLLLELYRLDRTTGAVIGKEADDEAGMRSRFYGPILSTSTAAYAGSSSGRLYRLPC